MSPRHPRFARLVPWALALTACAGPQGRPPQPAAQVPPPREAIVVAPPPATEEAAHPSTLPLALVDQLGKGDYAMAEKIALARLAVKEGDPWLLANLGLARLHLGRPEEALVAFEAARRDPVLGHDPRLLNEIGMCFRRLGRLDEAEQAYRQAIQEAPDYAPAWRNLGILFELYRQRPAAAVGFYRRYIELGGTDADTVRRWLVDIAHRRAPEGDPS